MNFSIVPLSKLRAHEMPRRVNVEELKNDFIMGGVLIKPIVVDRNTMVILDGHCRCDALKRLGCSKVAVKFVDYRSDEIAVERWDGGRITKSEVIEAGLSGNLMKPKTSRHLIFRKGRRLHISEMCRDECISLEKLS